MKPFSSADILLPADVSMEKWAVIACDQFVSQPEYWQQVRDFVGTAPSTLHIMLPEADLETGDTGEMIRNINHNMDTYLKSDLFCCHPDSFIYVERTLLNGTIRRGVVGAVDLDAYDYSPDSVSAIRATEKTVAERIPPRMDIRRDAPVELPHVLLLCDDERKKLIDSVAQKKNTLPNVYDFELMAGGGRIRGWLVSGDDADAFRKELDDYEQHIRARYEALGTPAVVYAVGDGNHSLASAKGCYEELKQKSPGLDLSNHPARFALVELENIHDEAQVFEPIHRIIKATNPEKLLAAMDSVCCDDGCPVQWFSEGKQGTVRLKVKPGQLPLSVMQSFLDEYLSGNAGQIDYIHGDDALQELAQVTGSIGFLLPAIDKDSFFRGISVDGVLPRKTFSMGHAQEKRYYLEARKIKL
jgi:hypothetical protein